MKGIIIEEPRKLEVKEFKTPEISLPEEVLVKVEGCGVCGTDIHLYQGLEFAKYPVIPGHEFIGEIIKMGKTSENYFKVGDRVAIDPNLPCYVCQDCRKGRYNLCSNMVNIGVNKDGGFAEYTVVNYKQIYHVPSGLDLKIAVLAEPVSCIIHGIEKANLQFDDKVLIIGAGPIGILTHKILEKVFGVKDVFIQEINEKRIENAQKLGVKNISKSYSTSFDVIFEMSGSVQGFEESLKILNKGGTLVQFGVAQENSFAKINQYSIYKKELNIIGSFVNPYTMAKALMILDEYSPAFSGIVDKEIETFEELSQILTGEIKTTDFTKAILRY
jgi:hypothetical protein